MMHKALHTRNDIDSMASRKEVGRELANIEDCVD